MTENLDYISSATELEQSETFGEDYKNINRENESVAFNTPFFKDVNEILNNILFKYNNLSDYQKEWLYAIFESFNNIRTIIDPIRLKSFEHDFNNDNELLLYRKSNKGLTNIILNPDECVAYSFIGYNNNVKELNFYYSLDDVEGLAYNFFSK